MYKFKCQLGKSNFRFKTEMSVWLYIQSDTQCNAYFRYFTNHYVNIKMHI